VRNQYFIFEELRLHGELQNHLVRFNKLNTYQMLKPMAFFKVEWSYEGEKVL